MRIMKYIPALLILLMSLAACQSATPLPSIKAITGSEFTLAPGQSAFITNAGLTLQLVSVSGDNRCPLKIECAVSGPVSLTISVQKDSAAPVEFSLETLTDNDGRTPKGQFQGIQNQVEYEGFVIRVTGVLPFPQNKFGEIKDADYRVSFLVAGKLIDI